MQRSRNGFLASCVSGLLLMSCGGDTAPIISGPAPSPTVSPSPSPTPTPTPTPSGTLQLVFSDEFNSGSLDRSVWNVEGPSFFVNNELQAYVDSAETIRFGNVQGADGGALILQPRWQPGFITPTGRRVDFVSGRIDTRDKFDVTYGKVEARIRMPNAVGVWPAFWMLGYGQWPDAGETDIMEYVGDPTWTASAIHGPGYSGANAISKRYNFPSGQDVAEWHTYSVERTTNELIFYVDDNEYHRLTRSEVEQRGPWRFDRRQFLILNFALGGDYPASVNSVSSPYFGLPQSTVDRIQSNEIFMEVDWVRVYERQ